MCNTDKQTSQTKGKVRWKEKSDERNGNGMSMVIWWRPLLLQSLVHWYNSTFLYKSPYI